MISFVVPVYNEEETLPELASRLRSVMAEIREECEVVLVDDGSSDHSLRVLKSLSQQDERFKFYGLSRNFGHQAALTAGVEHATGDAVIIMDADLQDPPEVAIDMIQKWYDGYDIVYGKRIKRDGETIFKKLTAAVYYRLLRKLTKLNIPTDTGDFRLVDRRALEAFSLLGEKNRFIRGMFAWIGFKQTAVMYHRDKRYAGESKYPLGKMLRFAFDGIISVSTAPLHMVFFFGLTMAGLAAVAGCAALFLKLFGFYTVRGWTTIMLLISFTAGVQIAILGVLGEYIARIVEEVKSRPVYLVRESSDARMPDIKQSTEDSSAAS